MLRLRSCVLTRLLSPPPTTSPIFSLRRLLSAAAPAAVSPNPGFAVEDYLDDTCGLSRAQALKASAKLSHLKSPSNPDAVVAFLSGLGFSSADVAAAVARNPKILCAKVERTLAPIVVELSGLGLSRSEIARLFLHSSVTLRLKSIVSRLQYLLPLLGSSEILLRAVKRSSYLLTSDLEKVVKPNVAFLGECGLGACDIAKLCIYRPRLLNNKPELIQAVAECAEAAIGVPRGSGMFREALHAVADVGKEKIAAHAEYLKKAFRWSDAETRIAISKFPSLLSTSKGILQSRSEFLISKVGLEPAYIARRPSLVTYSLEGRLRPRYYVVKFLKANGLLDHNRDYYSTVMISEKIFLEKYICAHKEAAPHLAEDYAAACRGEVPTRFTFT